MMEQGVFARTRVFFVFFLVVFDVGDEDKEDWEGTRGYQKARPWLEGGQALFLENNIYLKQDFFPVYKHTLVGPYGSRFFSEQHYLTVYLLSFRFYVYFLRRTSLLSVIPHTTPHICTQFLDFSGYYYSARLLLLLRVFSYTF